MHTFKAKVEQAGEGGAWMVVNVPRKVSEAFGTKGRVSVVGTVNGFAIKTSIFPNGDGTHHFMFNKAMQQGANATAGDTVCVELERADSGS
ncbi:MAG TPA: DUF1905 domain-containing protein [Phycisphaerales bacterium]|nr:DUF1905 domain-containing protein [Phycisphaerales bacterium]